MLSEQFEQSAEYMRMAIPLMNKFEIPITPNNYAVFYEYASGADIRLRAIIDNELSENGTISCERIELLYDRFIGNKSLENNIAEQRSDLRRLLLEIQQFAQIGGEVASSSQQHLAEAIAKLSPNMSPQDVNVVINDVMKETQRTVTSTTTLSDQCQSTLSKIEQLESRFEQEKIKAKTDKLTGLANRRAFDEEIQYFVEDNKKNNTSLSLIICDVDLFGEVNKSHGKLVGDQVLKIVANVLQESIGDNGYVARYQGDEFMILLPKRNPQEILDLANLLREKVSIKRIRRRDSKQPIGQVTLSCGVANYSESEGVSSFLQRADRALYQAKQKGGNTISEAAPPAI